MAMKRIRLLVSVLAVGFSLLPSTALASAYSESVFGVETGIPVPCPAAFASDSLSSFAGIASGTLNGTFQIAVCHTPLVGLSGATILGGTYAVSSGTTTVTGQFASGGTVSAPKIIVAGSLCIEKYAVSGSLLPSPGQFLGTLVHYGFSSGISCNVFFATISGSAQITFP
jgi:hypothetical protein